MSGLTLIRQSEEIRQSGTYDDTVAPSLANFETNPTRISDDLNNVRSQLSNLMDVQVGNWYDDIPTPSTFEGGTQRGVTNLNQDLHDLERKRVLRCVWNLHTVTIGSAGDTYVVLGTGELPSNTTAALGVVSTRGTVIAAHGGTFGTADLTEVAGATAISPKNLMELVDTTNRDPILDAGDRIYGLLQAESGISDGTTITDSTTTRAQISFVKINGSGTDLIAISSGAMDGITFDYCSVERVALEDLNEQDFLGGATVDVPAGATVTRQAAYDNQGATPVDQTTNAIFDLEGAGLSWLIRDDLEANLFGVVEGSAGGTSQINVYADVDEFDVDAAVNDFANGATFNSSGSRDIRVGVSDGIIDTVAGDLEVRGTGELYLDDGNQPGSWAQTAGVKLSDTSTEWSDYETAFGGEVSLLNAIVQANAAGADPVRTFHDQTGAAVPADTDVFGPSQASNNITVDWPDEFVTAGILNTWVFLNGRLMQPAAASGSNDYYPGSVFSAGNVRLKFNGRVINPGDVFISLYWP